MTTEYKWLIQIYWMDMDAICTPDDSLERSLYYQFDTLAEAEKFMMLYRLQHNCMSSDSPEWVNTPDAHEIILITPLQQKEYDEQVSPVQDSLLHQILASE